MSYLVLARKYRPQNFDEVVCQDHVTRTLKNAITSNRVAHAILFSGPRGTGKTTIARIMAKAMNCVNGPTPTPCNVCRSCQEITSGSAADVFEIDGASNNGVEQIRDLRDNVQYMPSHSTYKIYIIDEVHMLSVQAFNALLKTLEEPPSHVLFFFATTEPQKIPITILSRCQRHDLRRVDLDAVKKHLARLCRKEGIEFPEQSLDVIARESGGSVRDSLSLLDQVMVCTEGQIRNEDVLNILGIIDRKVLFDLSAGIFRGDIPALLNILDEIYAHGHNLKLIYADLTEHFRNLLIVKMGKKTDQLVDVPAHERDEMANQVKIVDMFQISRILEMLCKEDAGIRYATRPKLAIEMVFIKLLYAKPTLPIDVLIEKLDVLQQSLSSDSGFPIVAEAAENWKKDEKIQPKNVEVVQNKNFVGEKPSFKNIASQNHSSSAGIKNIQNASVSRITTSVDCEKSWEDLIDQISEKNPPLGAALNKCCLKNVDEHEIAIEISGNGFNQKTINKHKQALTDYCRQYFDTKAKLVLSSAKDNGNGNGASNVVQNPVPTAEKLRQEATSHPMVTAAMEIFQGGKIIDVKILNG